MKDNVNYIASEEFEQLIKASGLPARVQSGFVKVSGAPGRNLYVARCKRVGRVDVSGFEVREQDGSHSPGFVAPHVGEFGQVKQQIDFSLPKEEVLRNFQRALDLLKTLPARESALPKETKSKAPSASKRDDAAREARLAKLKAQAAKKKASSPAAGGIFAEGQAPADLVAMDRPDDASPDLGDGPVA